VLGKCNFAIERSDIGKWS